MRQLWYTSATQLVSDGSTKELWGNESIVGEIFRCTPLGQYYNLYYYYLFFETGLLECYLGCQEWRSCYLCFLRGLYYAVHCRHFGRPGLQQVYESPSRTMIHLLLHTKQGGGWGTGGTFQAFLCWWICHMQLLQLSLGIYQSVLFVWNFGCTVICHYSCFWIVCSNNLKSQRIIAFYLFSVWKWVHKMLLGVLRWIAAFW